MNTTLENGVLPVLMLQLDEIDVFASSRGVSTARESKAAKTPNAADLARLLSCQAPAAEGGNSITATVMHALYKKSGLGPLSGMLKSYNC